MFLRVVDTVITQEIEVNEELDNDRELEGVGLPDNKREELFDLHGLPLLRESD